MERSNTKDEQLLLSQVPDDGSSIGNGSLRHVLRWSETRYWPVRDELVRAGLLRIGRGYGGSVRRTIGDEELLLSHVPGEGNSIGNISLRHALGWDEERYWKVRNALVGAGHLIVGGGKGGSVRRDAAGIDDVDETLEENVEDRDVATSNEKDLYPSIMRELKNGWAKERHLAEAPKARLLVEITAASGKRGHGPWRRPDITLVSIRPFDVIGHALDVHTFEVKRAGAWDVESIYQASAHGRRATHAYAFVVGDADDVRIQPKIDRCKERALHLHVGLIVAENPGDYSTWDVVAEPKRHPVDPTALEAFVSDGISQKGKEQMRAWRDTPRGG